MAKVILILEDVNKDGQALVQGEFKVEGAPIPAAPGLPAESTPAQLLMTTIQRMWDCNMVQATLRMAVPDLLFKNSRLKEQQAKMDSGSMPLPEGPVIEGTVNQEMIAAQAALEADKLQRIQDSIAAPGAPAGLVDGVQADAAALAAPLPDGAVQASVAQPSEGGCST